MAADTCELRATRQKVKASAICFVLPSRLPLELGGEGSADLGLLNGMDATATAAPNVQASLRGTVPKPLEA